MIKKKAPASISEFQLQKLIIDYVDRQKPAYFIFSVPNGGYRGKFEALRLKQTGVRAGVADLCVLFPNGHSFFLELKTAQGKQSEKQKEFEKVCRHLGFHYHLIRSFEDYQSVIQMELKWVR